jgi:hypothetical protein
VSSAVVVEKLAVELPFALQDSLGHSSLTLELVGLLVGNSFAASEIMIFTPGEVGVVSPPWIVGVGEWVVLGRVLSYIVILLLI